MRLRNNWQLNNLLICPEKLDHYMTPLSEAGSTSFHQYLALNVNLSNSPPNPLKFFNKRSHFLKKDLLFGQVQRVEGAHFGEHGVEFGAVVAGVFALE